MAAIGVRVGVEPRPDDIFALGFLARGQVLVQGARVLVQVLGRAELERVDEDGDRDRAARAGQLTGPAEQRPVAVVQGAHRRHED